jgi:peptidoglycan/xylan/chitin deacetylase (PgdA/CDA1 family)
VRASDDDKEVVCFVYHRFADARFPSTNISLKDFEAHLKYLVLNNFQVLSLSDAIDYLDSREVAKPTVVITIDDGYESFYQNGLPLLKKYGLPATLFINTSTVGGGDYMNWEELAEVVEQGVEIGNHTHTHSYFLNEPEATRYQLFHDEISLSQSLFKEHLSLTPGAFSYPYGEFDEKMEDVVRNAGFKGAVAQNSGVLHSGMNYFRCPRFPMSEAYAPIDKFKEKSLMKALRIIRSVPEGFTLPEGMRPALALTFNGAGLRLQELQCFVQGGKCTYNLHDNNDGTFALTLQAEQPLQGRRRTLYTVTVPDGDKNWHWYSHLWINAAVK